MATLTLVHEFKLKLADGLHDLENDVFKILLTDVAPTTATTDITGLTAPTNTNGYTAGGNTLTITTTMVTSTTKILITDTTFTASGGAIGPFRYAVIYNSSVSNFVVGYIDYGSSISLNSTESFVIQFDQTNGALAIT